jgi:hypothetical protein
MTGKKGESLCSANFSNESRSGSSSRSIDICNEKRSEKLQRVEQGGQSCDDLEVTDL